MNLYSKKEVPQATIDINIITRLAVSGFLLLTAKNAPATKRRIAIKRKNNDRTDIICVFEKRISLRAMSENKSFITCAQPCVEFNDTMAKSPEIRRVMRQAGGFRFSQPEYNTDLMFH